MRCSQAYRLRHRLDTSCDVIVFPYLAIEFSESLLQIIDVFRITLLFPESHLGVLHFFCT